MANPSSQVRQSLEGELGMLEQKKQKLLAQVEVVRAQRDAIAGREKQLQDEVRSTAFLFRLVALSLPLSLTN